MCQSRSARSHEGRHCNTVAVFRPGSFGVVRLGRAVCVATASVVLSVRVPSVPLGRLLEVGRVSAVMMVTGDSVTTSEWVASFGVWPFVFIAAGLLVVVIHDRMK